MSHFVEQEIKPIYHTKEWKAWRKEILGDNPSCLVCGKTKPLHIHHLHKTKIGDPYIGASREDIVILCKSCHWAILKGLSYFSFCGNLYRGGNIFSKNNICWRHPESPDYKRKKEWNDFMKRMDDEEEEVDTLLGQRDCKYKGAFNDCHQSDCLEQCAVLISEKRCHWDD
jgi:hypothetical protein